MINREEKVAKARDLFMEGYNCAQAVAAAYAPEMGLDEKTALLLSSAFGGGFGGLRHVCGAFSGMCMALGRFRGYDTAGDMETKKHLYATVQRLSALFCEKYETLTCRDLLVKAGCEVKNTPSERTPEYYKQRPCVRYVEACAALLADELNGEEQA